MFKPSFRCEIAACGYTSVYQPNIQIFHKKSFIQTHGQLLNYQIIPHTYILLCMACAPLKVHSGCRPTPGGSLCRPVRPQPRMMDSKPGSTGLTTFHGKILTGNHRLARFSHEDHGSFLYFFIFFPLNQTIDPNIGPCVVLKLEIHLVGSMYTYPSEKYESQLG